MNLADVFYISESSPSGLRWLVRRNNRTPKDAPAGCIDSNDGYYAVKFNYKKLRLHRVIAVLAGIIPDYDSPYVVDHIDGNVHNNKVHNLRAVTVRGNTHNKTRHREGHLVGAHKTPNGRWKSAISIDGVIKYLGRFDTELDANRAYLTVMVKIEEQQ